MKRKIIKIISASGLAIIMGIGTLCGVVISPMNSTRASTSGSEENLLTPQEQLLAGTLELDPENDPVLGSTESGIEIKYHNRALTGTWDYDAFMKNYVGQTNSPTYGKSTFPSLSGYFYVTLGGYNWVIIGRNSNVSWTNLTYTNTYAQSNETISNFIKFASYSTYANAMKGLIETSTDAGIALNSANSKGLVNTVSGISRSYSINLASYTSPVVPSSGEIPSGCVLCLSEGIIGTSMFNSSGDGYFPDGELDITMTNIYNNIKSAAGNQIQSTSLKTYGYNGSSYITYSHSEYLFPLARNREGSNFYVSTYLSTDDSRNLGQRWWLRTGMPTRTYRADCVYLDGGLGSYTSGNGVTNSYGVRPAFVLKIT